MKKGIFNEYVKLICDGSDITQEELFSDLRSREIARPRYLLYKLCHERPMTINQIVSLMYGRGFDVKYETVRRAIIKITKVLEEDKDKDLSDFFDYCLKKAQLCC